MLTTAALADVVAHVGVRPDDLWAARSTNPLVWAALAGAAIAYGRGHRRHRACLPTWRPLSFAAGLAALAAALVSPLDAMSGALASAHMVQHLLLTTIAAPLLVAGRPMPTLVAGLPSAARRSLAGARRALRRVRPLTRDPLTMAALHTAVLWSWHAAGPYGAAFDHAALHAVEHAMFLVTALLAWGAVVDAARARRSVRARRAVPGAGVLALFVLSLQGALLGALLTFAPSPWYAGYATTTAAWGLTALADQQLAGVVMWVPGGAAYLLVALWSLLEWVGDEPVAGETEPARQLTRPTVAS